MAGRFDEIKYRTRGLWYGTEIMTMPLFCSYGKIGYTVTVYGEHEQHELSNDWELDELTIDQMPYKDFINLLHLEEDDIVCVSDEPVWDRYPRSVELECYTDAGEDMIIDLKKPTKKCLQEYIDDFDINESVMMWWQNGQPGDGVPFDNIMDHAEDYKSYLHRLQNACNRMPY